jgi:CheY-like chemotaxis protein
MTARHRILVVDDDDTIRESLVDFLGDNGFPATGAVHGLDALNKLNPAEPPCLIVLDLMMPVMDGRAFRQQQLLDPVLAAIPTVVMSAHRNVDSVVAEVEPVAYLKKPLNLDQLLALVQRHCASH